MRTETENDVSLPAARECDRDLDWANDLSSEALRVDVDTSSVKFTKDAKTNLLGHVTSLAHIVMISTVVVAAVVDGMSDLVSPVVAILFGLVAPIAALTGDMFLVAVLQQRSQFKAISQSLIVQTSSERDGVSIDGVELQRSSIRDLVLVNLAWIGSQRPTMGWVELAEGALCEQGLPLEWSSREYMPIVGSHGVVSNGIPVSMPFCPVLISDTGLFLLDGLDTEERSIGVTIALRRAFNLTGPVRLRAIVPYGASLRCLTISMLSLVFDVIVIANISVYAKYQTGSQFAVRALAYVVGRMVVRLAFVPYHRTWMRRIADEIRGGSSARRSS